MILVTSNDSSSDEDSASVVSVVMESAASPLASHATKSLLGRRKKVRAGEPPSPREIFL